MMWCLFGERSAQVKTVFVASYHHVVISYVNVRGGGRSTQETDGVEGHLKFRTGANESAAHWLYLQKKGVVGQFYRPATVT